MRAPALAIAATLAALSPAAAEEGLIQGLWDGAPSCLLARVRDGAVETLYQTPPETGPRDWWVADLEGVMGQNRGGAPVSEECGCIEAPIVPLAPKLQIEGPAVAANLPLRLPAKQELLSTESVAYVKAVREALAARGFPADVPVRLTHVLRTDFEGDGVDEVILAGGWNPFVAEATAEQGYYTFLLLRRLVDGAVVTEELDAWWDPAPAADFMPLEAGAAASVPVALFDADGDGTVELATASWGHEFLSYYLWALTAEGPVELASCGCGC